MNEPVRGPNLNPSPKTRFLQSGNNISEHRAMMEARPFQRAIDYALLEYQAQLATEVSSNPQVAAFSGLKMTGAQEFIQTLRLLSETATALPKRQSADNLDHKA